jgi:hypothetical protein
MPFAYHAASGAGLIETRVTKWPVDVLRGGPQ